MPTVFELFIFRRNYCEQTQKYLRINMAVSNANGHLDAHLSAPKYGTLIPNRIFVGGIR